MTASGEPDVSGTAVDDTSGAPVGGAAVSVGAATATTAADGSFDVKNVAASTATVDFTYLGAGYPIYPNAQWVDILPVDGHAAYHAIRSIATTGTTSLGTIAIALPSASDVAWLTRINADRATLGVPPVTAPLAFDSITLQTARYWATQMQTGGFFGHACPPAPTACVAFWLYATQRGGLPSAQNIDQQRGGGTWQAAEAAFMAETANCPGGNWQTCTYGETTGHYINIMQAMNWAGVGSAGPDFVENFATPDGVDALYFRHVPQHPHALQF